jgi:hypothetical protein
LKRSPQAVIAIENVRLFDAEQQRSRELSEIAAATDRHRRGAAGDLKLAGRLAAGVCGPAGERGPHLQGQVRQFVSLPGQLWASRS